MILDLTFLEKFHQKRPEALFSTLFSQDNFGSEVVNAILTTSAGMKVVVKFGDSRSSRSRDIRQPQIRDGRR